MLLRIYLGLGVLITVLYATSALLGWKGPQFASSSGGSQAQGGTRRSQTGGGWFPIGGRGSGGSSSTWHGGK